jgi:benzoyl-CoA-dihydrodiol lyase
MRTNELDIGTWLIKTEGDAAAVLAMDATLMAHQGHWLVRETIGLLRRTFSRLDVSSRSLFALIEPGSCFAGSFLELALACDRSYHAGAARRRRPRADDHRGDTNFGLYPMATGQSRLGRRFYDEQPALEAVRAKAGQPLDADAAFAAGPGHQQPRRHRLGRRNAHRDRGARGDEPRRADRLEANLRFNGPETMFTRIFGRLTAWQNWIFQRPNAVGEKGALKVYGKGDKAAFDWNRV